MKYFFILIVVFLSGCPENRETTTYNPTPAQVAGVWESLSLYQVFPFGALKINSDGSGEVVLVTTENTMATASLANFRTAKESFFITLISDEEGDEPELWEGSLRRGQLCFHKVSENESKEGINKLLACFTRSSEISTYRTVAFKELGVN